MKMNVNYNVIAQFGQRGLQLAALLALLLSVGAPTPAQSPAAVAPANPEKIAVAPAATATVSTPVATSPAATDEKPAAKGQHEGIVVHGHWIIEVKNPDGTTVARQEFENAIDPVSGADILTGLLSGDYVAGGFFINLSGPSGLCANVSGVIFGQTGPSGCLIVDARNTVFGSASCSSSLGGACGSLTYSPTSSVPGSTTAAVSGYTLSGNVTLQTSAAGGTITYVGTGAILCFQSTGALPTAQASTALANVVSPQFCGTISGLSNPSSTLTFAPEQMTSHAITQVVGPGQTIAVTVAITFSGV